MAWPNDPFVKPEPPAPWLAVEAYGDGSEPIELGLEAAWLEEGSIDVHVMIPVGSGISTGLAIRKEVQDLFRGIEPAELSYDGAALNRLGPTADDKLYRPLTVRIFYRYQSR